MFPPAPQPVKKAEVIHGSTGDEPGTTAPTTAPVVSKPPRSDFNVKIPDYEKQFPNLVAKNDELMKSGANRAATQIRKDVIRGNLPYSKAREALESLGMGEKFVKSKMPAITHYAKKLGLVAAESPDDKMNTMNSVNKENQTLQQGQSGSPTILNTTNAQSSNIKQGDLVTAMNSSVHAQKLVETNADS